MSRNQETEMSLSSLPWNSTISINEVTCLSALATRETLSNHSAGFCKRVKTQVSSGFLLGHGPIALEGWPLSISTNPGEGSIQGWLTRLSLAVTFVSLNGLNKAFEKILPRTAVFIELTQWLQKCFKIGIIYKDAGNLFLLSYYKKEK